MGRKSCENRNDTDVTSQFQRFTVVVHPDHSEEVKCPLMTGGSLWTQLIKVIGVPERLGWASGPPVKRGDGTQTWKTYYRIL